MLITKFSKPYVNSIPEIIRYLLSFEQQEKLMMTKNIGLSELDNLTIMNNIIENLLRKEDDYFLSKNFFEINYIEIDNMANRYPIKFKIESLFQKKLKYDKIHPEYVIYDDDINTLKEREKIKDKNNCDEMGSGNENLNRSYSSSRLPSENLFNNRYLKDFKNREKEDGKIKEVLQMREKYNLRLVKIKISIIFYYF